MPDITMCTNSECPIREFCYRYRAIPSDFRQSYCDFHFTRLGDCVSKCFDFWDLREYKHPVESLEKADERRKYIKKG